jgi:hypothetical protein
MKDCNLGDYLFYEGRLVRCVALNQGLKEAVLETIEDHLCPHCGGCLGKEQIHVIVGSPNFQTNAEPLPTITTK